MIMIEDVAFLSDSSKVAGEGEGTSRVEVSKNQPEGRNRSPPLAVISDTVRHHGVVVHVCPSVLKIQLTLLYKKREAQA